MNWKLSHQPLGRKQLYSKTSDPNSLQLDQDIWWESSFYAAACIAWTRILTCSFLQHFRYWDKIRNLGCITFLLKSFDLKTVSVYSHWTQQYLYKLTLTHPLQTSLSLSIHSHLSHSPLQLHFRPTSLSLLHGSCCYGIFSDDQPERGRGGSLAIARAQAAAIKPRPALAARRRGCLLLLQEALQAQRSGLCVNG